MVIYQAITDNGDVLYPFWEGGIKVNFLTGVNLALTESFAQLL
jgi:hypothetical protein